MLTFSEELVLLLHYSAKENTFDELDEETSNLIAAGAVLVKLLLIGRLRLDEGSLVIVDDSPTGDDLLDEALRRLSPAQPLKPADPEWIRPLVAQLPFASQLMNRLLAKGVIHQGEKRGMFGLSRSVIYPVDPVAIQQLVDRELQVMVQGAKPDPQTAALLFMITNWGYEQSAVKLSRKEKKAYQKRAEALFGDYWGVLDQPAEPIEGLEPAVAKAIGEVIISWATVRASYITSEYNY